ncbi:hypothetical protein MHO82_22540 [Vibrio sp. Of7-15]|uniref:hypothetical protein n=1 Tax=Vibrio sp. Of7-15 TaxID=2724879 RepID=UPI001EF302B1|nr:hypothetical protein [Vibrio sp. Of7-15]MCG7499647.1 hypothetical protein [Vibrio sp. Of7-15]
MIELVLVFTLPLGIVFAFLLAPIWIPYFTNKENKYFRFDRLHKLEGVKNRTSGRQLFWMHQRAAGLYLSPVIFSIFLCYCVDSQEVAFLIIGLIHLISTVYICFHEPYSMYLQFKGFRKVTHLFWGVNMLLAVINFVLDVSLLIFLISLMLMMLWTKKVERALVYSQKLSITVF